MRAGFGKYEITPPMGVELSGFGYYLGRCALSVNDPLYARAVMLESGGTRTLIISCDLLGLSRAVCQEVFEHAAGYGVAPENVLIMSVHTHCGPCIKYHEGCGYPDPDYVSAVGSLICKAAAAAYADMDEVSSLTHMCSECPGDHIYNRADPDGPVDRLVRGFMLKRAAKPDIAIVSAACHGVFRGRSTAVSADFSGAICRILDENGMHGIYLNGLCGDIDPYQPTEARLNEYAAQVAAIYLKGHSPLQMTLDCGSASFDLRLTSVSREEIVSAAAQAVERAGGPDTPQARVALTWEKEMLDKLDTLVPTETIYAKYIILGGVPVMALPFEGFTRIGMDIRSICGRHDALILGCAEELLGYLPTKDDIDRGAYAALESTFLYKRLPVVPGEAERLGEEMGKALRDALKKA